MCREITLKAKKIGLKNNQISILKDQLERWSKAFNNIDRHQKILNLILGLYNQGDFLAARDEGNKYISEIPNSEILHNLIGMANAGLNRSEEAIKSYKSAICIKPDYSEAYNNLGSVYQKLNDLSSAKKNFKRAILINPGLAVAHNNLGLLSYEMGELSEATHNFERAIDLEPPMQKH